MRHYDLEQIERDFRANMARPVTPPENAKLGSIVLMRNRELTLQLMLLALREQNRGTQAVTIIEAVASAAAEFIFNFGIPYDAEDQEIIEAVFKSSFHDSLLQARAGAGLIVSSTHITSEAGGHA